MAGKTERLNGPISTTELQRRWTALRAAMAEAGIDVLVMQNNNDHMGGYVKYVTDLPATNGYPVSVVFPHDAPMTFVRQGPFGGQEAFPQADDDVFRGIGRVLYTPSYSAAAQTRTYDAELIASALKPYAQGRIGLVGTYGMSHAHAAYLLKEFPQATFTEASNLVDTIRAVKSAEEIDLIRRTTALQDKAMRAAMDAIEPGMRDSDVAAKAQYVSQLEGSEQGIYLCASAPALTPLHLGQRHFQNRTLRAGDQYILLIENNGSGGQYAEIGRTCVLGKISSQLADEFAFTLEARNYVLGLMQPGAVAADIFASYSDFMERNGRPRERRLFAHSQGYDMVERPLIRDDDTMTIGKRMNFAVHPSYVRDGVMSWVCDNYLIGDGAPERLHAFPEQIIER